MKFSITAFSDRVVELDRLVRNGRSFKTLETRAWTLDCMLGGGDDNLTRLIQYEWHDCLVKRFKRDVLNTLSYGHKLNTTNRVYEEFHRGFLRWTHRCERDRDGARQFQEAIKLYKRAVRLARGKETKIWFARRLKRFEHRLADL